MAIHRDTQWPCPNGFHVPTKDEWVALFNILLTTFGLTAADTTPIKYLRMPYTGFRSASTWSASTSPYGCYHSSTSYEENSNRTYSVYFTQTDFYAPGNYSKTNWMTIRPFKDEPVEPGSGWTILYDWSSVASGAWIFLNSTLSLISVSWDWTNWITIEAKNLWATEISDWDAFYPIAYASTSWNFFQRWNNHPFPWSWTVTTSSASIDASDYGPGKYYDSSIFRISTSALDWASPSNNNLWWGVTNGTWEDPLLFTHHGHIWTWHAIWHKDTQWPCPEWFHIPTMEEVNTLSNILWTDWSRTTKPDISDYLHIPAIWYIDKDWNVPSQREYSAFIWTCNATGTKARWWILYALSSVDRASMMPIRPFKDEPVAPDNSWTVEYQPEWATWGDTIWVYHSSTLWLISISKDWETWITIADKNLWATQVFADDYATPTAANVGNLYQRWNNYWIPYWTTPTISQTQVDASWYWPTQPYSSSTIIRWNSDWSSVKNDNLWWWVTNWMRYEVK